MGPVLVVMGFIIAQDLSQMGLVPDEGAVQELAAASPDPAFGDRVHPGRPDVAERGPDAGVGQDCVERGGEIRATVADHELDPVRLFSEVHEKVAGLLRGPFKEQISSSRAGWLPLAMSIQSRPAAFIAVT